KKASRHGWAGQEVGCPDPAPPQTDQEIGPGIRASLLPFSPAHEAAHAEVPESEWPARRLAELLLRVPEDLVDLPDQVEQLLSLIRIGGLLGVAGFLGGVPEQLMELRVRLDVLGLEVVGPQ